MALNQRKWQKKVEKRNAKQKAKKKELARREREEPLLRIARAAMAPVLHSVISADLWKHGIGQVLLSRQLASGNVASVLFLLDVYCLGVKDAIVTISPRDVYESKYYNRLRYEFGMKELAPESLRKLVEGAVFYAAKLGLSPHPDYELALILFGDLDVTQSRDEFQYGKNGKPLFISGPNDTPQKCGRIMNALMSHSGLGNFDYLVEVGTDKHGQPDLQSIIVEPDDEDDDPRIIEIY